MPQGPISTLLFNDVQFSGLTLINNVIEELFPKLVAGNTSDALLFLHETVIPDYSRHRRSSLFVADLVSEVRTCCGA